MSKIKLRVELVKTTSPPFHYYNFYDGDDWVAEIEQINYSEYAYNAPELFFSDHANLAEIKQKIALLEAIAAELEKLNKEIKQ